MPKDALLYDRLTALGLAGRTFTPTPPDVATLCLAHDPAYVDAFLTGTLDAAAMRRIGLPWSEALVRRTLIGVGSAVLAARVAAQLGVAVMCNGGTHHAHAGRGAGWCIFNDQAVAARAAQRDAGVATAMFVDLDTHLGDGTAAIFRDGADMHVFAGGGGAFFLVSIHHQTHRLFTAPLPTQTHKPDPSVFTLSMHCKDQSFPAQLERSDLDIALPAGTGDAEYLEVWGRPPFLF
jgi:acetoin utilization deacetylase AcuC-like enzyme